jgi:FtsZ-binding cell division protein ZapB
VSKTKNEAAAMPLDGTEEGEILARLAERVERAVETITRLRREKDDLQQRLDALTSDLQEQSEEAERLRAVEEENSRYRGERDQIRNRIESMLENLEALEEESGG